MCKLRQNPLWAGASWWIMSYRMFRIPKTLAVGAKPSIIAAPMNGGINNATFAAAVINAGGVGSFGFTYHTKEAIERDITSTRARCRGPINANFFAYNNIKAPSEADIRAAVNDLKFRMTIGNDQIKVPAPPYHLDLSTQIEGVWKMKPEILTFHFGIPDRAILREAKRLNICVGITATSLEEAQCIQESGADLVVAQGIEAGGHRGMFNSTWKAQSEQGDCIEESDTALSTLDLVSLLSRPASSITIPIVAAGGIMSGRDIYTMTRAGASAVQLGTAFLPCLECAASAAHKRYILEESPRETVLTTAFSGRPARGICNAFIDRMDGARTLPFPLQNTLTSVLRAQAQRDDDGELQSLWVGAAYLQARSRLRDHDVAHARDVRLEGVWERGRESNRHYSDEQEIADGLKNESRMSASYPSAGALIELLHREFEQCQK